MPHSEGTTSGLSVKNWRLEIVMPTTRLYFTASVEEQWQALVGPWLREQAVTAWKNSKPTVILTPSRAESFYLRSRLVAEGVPYLGLRFWTPSDARKSLLAESSPGLQAATLAEQRLVARDCAVRLSSRASANKATLESVIREPGAFLRAYDLLLAAGWDPAREGSSYGRDLAKEFQRDLDANGIATQAGLHRHLRRQITSGRGPLIANLLVVGFNAAHWPLWDLLKAVVSAAAEPTVALLHPRTFGQDVDQLWNGSWEEFAQTIAESPFKLPNTDPVDEPAGPFAELVASYEQGAVGSVDAADLSFLVTPDLASQIRAVTLKALDYLKRDDCTRLGMVFPEANALALGVAEELRRLHIPLDDGTGVLTPGIFERRCWLSWITLQEEPGVQRLIAWMRACEAHGVSCGLKSGLSARRAADIIESALGETLVDDLNFLARHIEAHSKRPDSADVAQFLRRLIVLSEEATFGGFLALTRKAFSLPGWEEHLERLQIDPPKWLLTREGMLSRRIFLEWLKESTASQVRTRGAEGNHFYGKVHLLIYGQTTGQTWSHLILTGLNEGVWPRLFETGAFGSRHELIALNQQSRALNVRGTIQGGQGLGHETVAPDKGHCLLPLERQDLALRDLCAALDAASTAACLTALTTEAGRSLLPSDFFSHAFQSKTGHVLDEETFRNLAAGTDSWCRRHDPLFKSKFEVSSSDIEPTRIAYAARRDPMQPFGPFEFSFAHPPPRPIQLRCKQWEDAWNHPSTVWLHSVVGASTWPDGALSWQQAVGTWTHSWVATALKQWREQKSAATEFPVLIQAAADREASEMRTRAAIAGLDLYPWWEHVWKQARTRASQLGETLAPLLPEHTFYSEFTLPSQLLVTLPGSTQCDFELKGRIDFLRIEEGEVAGNSECPDFSGCSCWVIDFKTGASKPLSEKNVLKGTGLQAILYALAIRALGAETTFMSVLAPESAAEKQLELGPAVDPILASLEKLHREGIFGMRPDANSDYGYAPSYPIATQFVPSYILEAKWDLTHGGTEEVEA